MIPDCACMGKPVVYNNYLSLPYKKGMPDGNAEVVRELIVPTMKASKVVAILGVGNKPTEYTEKDIAILYCPRHYRGEETKRGTIKCAGGYSGPARHHPNLRIVRRFVMIKAIGTK
jgi:hypothetical protein